MSANSLDPSSPDPGSTDPSSRDRSATDPSTPDPSTPDPGDAAQESGRPGPGAGAPSAADPDGSFDDRSLACAVGVLDLGREGVEDIAVLSDEELMALDGVETPQMVAMPFLDEHAPDAETRAMLARTAIRSLMVRHLVISEVEAAEFEERPLKDERLLSVTAEPRLTGALVLRRASRALLVFEREVSEGMHRLYYYVHDQGVTLEEEVTADGVHMFCIMPASAVPQRVRHLVDQVGVAGADGEPRVVATSAVASDAQLAPHLEATRALTVGTMVSGIEEGAMRVHFHMTSDEVIAAQPSEDGEEVVFMSVSHETIEGIVADMVSAARLDGAGADDADAPGSGRSDSAATDDVAPAGADARDEDAQADDATAAPDAP